MLGRLTRILPLIAVFLACILAVSSVSAKKHARRHHHKNKTVATAPGPAIPANFPLTGMEVPELAAFDQKFVAFMRAWRIPGAALSVVKDGQLIYVRGYGWADIENHIPVAPNSLFRIASVSKLFTAATVLKLVEANKLSLDDKVFELLNDLQPLGNHSINPSIYQIKVRDLLNMSSGWFVPSGHFDPMFGPWYPTIADILGPELPASCENTARMMMGMRLRNKPGSQFAYSNLDYCLLGLVIDKTMNQPYGYEGYQAVVKNNMLAPLGIQSMVIGSTRRELKLPNEVSYYRSGPASTEELQNSAYFPYSNTEILRKNFSNGGWVASANDLAIFMYGLRAGKVLSPQMLEVMQTKPGFFPKNKSDYFTMGMKVYNINGQDYWIQTGSFTGTNAIVISKPDGTSVAVVFNMRPDAYSFFRRFRPELRNLLINKLNI